MDKAALDIIYRIDQYILNPLIYLLFGCAIIYFLWGVLKFVANAGSPDKREEGARHILWGIVGIAIMMSVFVILHFIMNTLNVPQSQRPTTLQL